jgi:hypothetical protein
MAHSYGHRYGSPTAKLRHFAINSPWRSAVVSRRIFNCVTLADRTSDVLKRERMLRDVCTRLKAQEANPKGKA